LVQTQIDGPLAMVQAIADRGLLVARHANLRVREGCARECTGTYSSCVSGDGQKSQLLRACHDAYSACVTTCSMR
jgi:hypothetical protein